MFGSSKKEAVEKTLKTDALRPLNPNSDFRHWAADSMLPAGVAPWPANTPREMYAGEEGGLMVRSSPEAPAGFHFATITLPLKVSEWRFEADAFIKFGSQLGCGLHFIFFDEEMKTALTSGMQPFEDYVPFQKLSCRLTIRANKRAARLMLYAVSHFPSTGADKSNWLPNEIIWKRVSVRPALSGK